MDIDLLQFELVEFLKLLHDADTHQVVVDLNANGPLGVVDVRKMAKSIADLGDCCQHLLVLEFIVVSTFEVQGPTLLLTLCLLRQQLLHSIPHLEVLSLKCFFDWRNSMAVSGELPIILHVFHDVHDDMAWVDLVLRIDLDEDATLLSLTI